MTKDFKSIIRGQIWWVDPGEVCGRLIRKTRPMLVVKEPENQLITVLPITMHEGPIKVSHVYYEGIKGVATILCEQITTVDICQVGKYHGTVSPDIMARVDAVLSVMLGLKASKEPKRTGRTWDDTMKMEFLESCKTLSVDQVSEKYEIAPKTVEIYIYKFKNDLASSNVVKIKRNRRCWSNEDKLMFVEDVKVLPKKEVSVKWNVPISRVYIYASRFEKHLERETAYV